MGWGRSEIKSVIFRAAVGCKEREIWATGGEVKRKNKVLQVRGRRKEGWMDGRQRPRRSKDANYSGAG